MGYFDSFPFLGLLIFPVHKGNFLEVKIKDKRSGSPIQLICNLDG